MASVTLLIPIFLLNRYGKIEELTKHDNIYLLGALLLLAIPFLMTYVLLRDIDRLQHQDLSDEKIKTVKSAAADQFPIAIGYIFIALSINNGYTLFISLLLLSMVCYYTPAYFNICLYVFGYRYYYVTTSDDIQILVPSRRNIGIGDKPSFMELRRINNLTFLDKER